MRTLLFCVSVLTFTACGPVNDQSSILTSRNSVSGSSNFPTQPDESLTPGATCSNPDTYRYPEHIAYCNRSVDRGVKVEVIKIYDDRLGYNVQGMDRAEFKIDHFIPLCMGGGNVAANLWPQHKSVYVHTDPLEEKLCTMMQQGKLQQRDAIAKIQHVKHNLSEADELNRQLDSQLGR